VTPPPASPDETPGADFARPVLERQLAKLERLADIGMEIAESLREQVVEAPVDPVAVTLAFSRVSRAVRLTFAMQIEVVDKLRGVGRIEDYEAGLAAPAAPAVAKEDPRLRARKDDIAATLTGIIDEIHKDAEGGEAHERCIREATERLKEAEDLGDILSRPFEEVVEQICRDLGLSSNSVHPDESRDPGFFSETAVRDEAPESRTRASPANPETENTWVPTFVGMNRGEEAPPVPPPDPDALPGYPVGLPGELPPNRRRPQRPPTNYTHGFD
jgi:hypothetical protein